MFDQIFYEKDFELAKEIHLLNSAQFNLKERNFEKEINYYQQLDNIKDTNLDRNTKVVPSNAVNLKIPNRKTVFCNSAIQIDDVSEDSMNNWEEGQVFNIVIPAKNFYHISMDGKSGTRQKNETGYMSIIAKYYKNQNFIHMGNDSRF